MLPTEYEIEYRSRVPLNKRSWLILCSITQRALICLFFICAFVSVVHGRDYAVRRKVEAFTVDIAINRNPPVMGKNDIRIGIKDGLGKHVLNVPVSVNYYMPPMPGMPPMNYTVTASPSGNEYRATMDFIMTGPWNIVIKTVIAEKQIRAAVPIDVR